MGSGVWQPSCPTWAPFLPACSPLAGHSGRLTSTGLTSLHPSSRHRPPSAAPGWRGGAPLALRHRVWGPELSPRPLPPQDMLRQHSLLLTLAGLLSLGSGEFCRTFQSGKDRPLPGTWQTHDPGFVPSSLGPPADLPCPATPSVQASSSSHPTPHCSPVCWLALRVGVPLTEPVSLIPSPLPGVYQVQGQHLPGLHPIGAWLCLVPAAGKSLTLVRPGPPSHLLGWTAFLCL